MTTFADTAHAPDRRPGQVLLSLLDRIAARDAAYRQAQKLRSLPVERLADMGLPADAGAPRPVPPAGW